MAMTFSSEDLNKGLEEYAKQCEDKINTYCKTQAQSMETYAKINRPWQDRTARARQGLKGTSQQTNGKYDWTIILSHSVDYGVFLELDHEKKFAIIKPTIDKMGVEVMQGFENLLGNLKL